MIGILILFNIVYYFINKYTKEGDIEDLWTFMGLGKSIISTMKYLYQIYLNKDR